MAKAKRINPVFRYFVPLGIRQIADILLLIASILTIVGLALSDASVSQIVLIVGISMYILAALIGAYRCTRVLTSGLNHRSPEYKSAVANLIIVGVIFAVAVFAMTRAIAW